MKAHEAARLVALRDITEDCAKRKDGRNYLLYEKDICESLGIPVPDFRQFNGGWNRGMRSEKPIYVTYFIRGKRKTRAVVCKSEEQAQEYMTALKARPDVINVRINKCGRLSNKIIIEKLK